MMDVSFVCHWNDKKVLDKCFQRSVPANRDDEILLLDGYDSMSKAYYDAEQKSKHDVVVFSHQDVMFPRGWRKRLEKQILLVEKQDQNWGLIGVVGGAPIRIDNNRIACIPVGNVTDKNAAYKHWLSAPLPCRAGWIDSCVAIKKKIKPKFDRKIMGWHGVIEDLCYAMYHANRSVWVANLPIHHAAGDRPYLDFMVYREAMGRTGEYLREKWKRPIFCGSTIFN